MAEFLLLQMQFSMMQIFTTARERSVVNVTACHGAEEAEHSRSIKL